MTRAALLAVALAAGCYSPSIGECTITCGAEGACPSDTTCMDDGFCHADISVSCFPLGSDGGLADAKPLPDAPPLPDGRREPDARPTPDATLPPDARPPDGGILCVNEITAIEKSDFEDSLISNLSVEPGGHVHITYYDAISGFLRYVHRVPGGDWHFEDVAPAADNLKGQALDVTGALHVAFTDNSLLSPRLRYARRSPQGIWKVETIDDSALGIDATVAVTPALRVYVAWWYDLTSLVYATRAGDGPFIMGTIDADGTVGEHPSIGISPSGAVNVSYRVGGTRNDLGLAVLKTNATSWNLSRPDQAGNVGSYTALAVDPAGAIHIAYSDFTNEQLKYAFLPLSGPNVITTVEPGVSVGRFNSIALDGKGAVHISYYAYGDQNLRYAVKRAGSATFTPRTLDSTGNVGRHSSIGVDASGAVHISYIDDTNGDLKYAHICP